MATITINIPTEYEDRIKSALEHGSTVTLTKAESVDVLKKNIYDYIKEYVRIREIMIENDSKSSSVKDLELS